MALRTCDRCGYKVAPGTPRTRVGDEMLCGSCVTSPRKEASMAQKTSLWKIAHDSGDGETIYHCFSCGSGKVIARSDRSTECMYCGAVFTVQVQPQYAAFPQTVDGMPTPVPGMPGQIDSGAPPMGGDPMGGDPMDPNAMDDEGGFPPAEGDEESPEEGDDSGDDEDDDSNAPPWAKKSIRTSLGHALDPDDFVRHLAIRHSVDPRAMAGLVKAERASS